MPLTQEEIDLFNEQGFLPREGLLNALEVKALHLRLEDIGNEVVEFPAEYVQIEPWRTRCALTMCARFGI